MVCFSSITQAAKFSRAKNISSDLHCNNLTNLLSSGTSANACLMSILSIMNTVWTLQLFVEITATYILVTLNQTEVTSETWFSIIPFSGIRSWWCSTRPSLHSPCTINGQFSLPAQLLFPIGASQPMLLEVSTLTECEIKWFSLAFWAGAPSPLACLPLRHLFFLVPTTSKCLLRRLTLSKFISLT